MFKRDMELNNKWSILLDDLSNTEAQKYEYASAYERIIENNDKKNCKMLLGIAHKIFDKDKTIKIKTGYKKEYINEFDDTDFCIGNGIIMDLMLPFIEAIADQIIEECHRSNNCFSHIECNNNKIYLIH